MKQSFENIEKLETISYKLERIHPKDKNAITNDMEWLVKQLREAWIREEDSLKTKTEVKGNENRR